MPAFRRPLATTAPIVIAMAAAMLLTAATGCGSRDRVLTPGGGLVTPAAFQDRTAQLDGLLRTPRLDPAGVLDARAALQRRLDLPRLHALATTLNPELRKAQATIIAAEGRLTQAGAWPNPVLDLGASQIPAGRRTSIRDTNLAAVWRQRFPVSGRLAAATREAGAVLQASEAAALARARELELAVNLAFVRYHVAVEQRRLHETIVAHRDEQLEIVRDEAAQGSRPTLDVRDAGARAARARLDLLDAQAAEAAATAALKQSVGDPDLLVGEPPEEWATPDEPLLLDQVRERSWVLHHPLVVAANRSVDAAEAHTGWLGTTNLEDLEVRVGYLYTGADDNHWMTAQLLIPFTIFDQADGAVREGRAREVAAVADRDAAVVALLSRLERWRGEYAASRERLRVVEEQLVPAVRERLELAERQSVSRVSTFELNEARVALLALEVEHWAARGRCASAVWQLRALLGE